MLYSGDLETDRKTVDHQWRRFHWSVLGRLKVILLESIQLEGELALARAAQAKTRKHTLAMKRELARVESLLGRLRSCRFPSAPLIELQLRAGLLRVRDQEEGLVEALRLLVDQFEQFGMQTGVAAAKQRLGKTLGGEEGRALLTESSALYLKQGVRNPRRFTELILPGWAP